MDEVSRSRLCLTATESALLCLMALNTSSCDVAAGLISKSYMICFVFESHKIILTNAARDVGSQLY